MTSPLGRVCFSLAALGAAAWVDAFATGLPLILGVHFGKIIGLELLRFMRMRRATIDAQLAQLIARQRAFLGHHALHGLFQHPLGVRTGKNEFRRGAFNAAGMAGMPVIALLLTLFAGELDFFRVDDDDMVASIDMRGEGSLMLAAQNFSNGGG